MGIENGGAAFLATVVSDPETTFSIFDPFQAGGQISDFSLLGFNHLFLSLRSLKAVLTFSTATR